ncbi:MAG: heat-inducible transcription repressor HrcA, partial [Firmicutes bacterium]|nr:heat-inducible transcription repressor HrcA [Bacillota bacterium]
DELMQDCSLITATYRINGKLVGKLGVIGPTRMKYDEVTSVIKFMTDNLSSAFQITTEGEVDEDE